MTHSQHVPSEPPMLRCPKCAGAMRTYERNGIHVEQCETCRGIFLDFGELEALTALEGRVAQQAPTAYGQQPQQAPPPYPQQPNAQQPYPQQPYPQQPYPQQPYPQQQYGPGWGHHGGRHYRKGGFGRLFFSS